MEKHVYDARVVWGDVIPASHPIEGVNERCIEIPLALEVMQLQQSGRVFDAGCSLNGKLSSSMQATVYHLTQNIGSETMYAHTKYALSYISGDLRDLSIFAGAAFDRTVCVSTLEHVGLDNVIYGGPQEACPDTMLKAVRELCRVTRRELFITVPYAEPVVAHAQWRFLGISTLGRMVRIATDTGFHVAMRFYVKCAGGWYGGELQPVEADPKGFPGAVNAIACLRCTQ